MALIHLLSSFAAPKLACALHTASRKLMYLVQLTAAVAAAVIGAVSPIGAPKPFFLAL